MPFTVTHESFLFQDIIVEHDLNLGLRALAIRNPITGDSEFLSYGSGAAVYVRRDEDSDTGWSEVTLPFDATHLTRLEIGEASYYYALVRTSPTDQAVYQLDYDEEQRTFQLGAVCAVKLPPFVIDEFMATTVAGGRLLIRTASASRNQELRCRERLRSSKIAAGEEIVPPPQLAGLRKIGPLAPTLARSCHHHKPTLGPNQLLLLGQDGYFMLIENNKALQVQSFCDLPELNHVVYAGLDGSVVEVEADKVEKSGYLEVEAPRIISAGLPRISTIKAASAEGTTYLYGNDASTQSLAFQYGDYSWMAIDPANWTDPVRFSDRFELLKRPDGKLEVVAQTVDNRLAIVDPDDGLALNLSPPNSIRAFSAIANDGTGTVDIFCLKTGASEVVHYWRELIKMPDGTLTMSDWRTESVQQQAHGEAHSVNLYRVQLSVSTDAIPMGGKAVNVRSSRDITCFQGINSFYLGPEKAVPMITDPTGNLALSLFTPGLHAPVLTLEFEGQEGTYYDIEPDANTRSYLADVSAATLLNAHYHSGGNEIPLIPSGKLSDAEFLQQTISQALRINLPDSQPFRAHSEDRVPTDSAADFSRVPCDERNWIIETNAGRPRFRFLSNETCQRLQESAVDASEFEHPKGFLGIDWGDLCEDVEEGFFEIESIVVSGAEKVVTISLKGIDHVLRFALKAAYQLLDIVVLAFKMIGTIRGTILGWLLEVTGFLFDWNGIRENKQQLKNHLFSSLVSLAQRAGELETLQKAAQSALEAAQNQFDQAIKQFIGSSVAPLTARQARSEGPPADVVLSPGGRAGTWLIDRLIDVLRSQNHTGVTLTAPLDSILTSFFSSLEAASTDFMNSVSDEIETLVTEIEAGESALGDLSLGTLIGIFESGADAIFKFLSEMVNAVFELLKGFLDNAKEFFNALDKPVDLPYFSAYYKAVLRDGSQLSLLDLSFLALAIPYTLYLDLGDDALGAAEIGMDAVVTVIAGGLWALLNAAADGVTVMAGDATPINLPGMLADVVGLLGLVLNAVAAEEWTADGYLFTIVGGAATLLDFGAEFSGVSDKSWSTLSHIATVANFVAGAVVLGGVGIFLWGEKLAPPKDKSQTLSYIGQLLQAVPVLYKPAVNWIAKRNRGEWQAAVAVAAVSAVFGLGGTGLLAGSLGVNDPRRSGEPGATCI